MKKNFTYQYVHLNNGDTVALTHFAGKCVKAVAHLKPGDVYVREIGEKIAAAKCDEKIAGLRAKRLLTRFDELYGQKMELDAKLDKYYDHAMRAVQEWREAEDALVDAIRQTGWVAPADQVELVDDSMPNPSFDFETTTLDEN